MTANDWTQTPSFQENELRRESMSDLASGSFRGLIFDMIAWPFKCTSGLAVAANLEAHVVHGFRSQHRQHGSHCYGQAFFRQYGRVFLIRSDLKMEYFYDLLSNVAWRRFLYVVSGPETGSSWSLSGFSHRMKKTTWPHLGSHWNTPRHQSIRTPL
nr:hypothetical protein CFP56_48793 [Quercus suber]